MKLFNGILGVFAAFAALFCFMYPGRTFLNAGWLVTFLLVCWGVCVLFDYVSNKLEKKSKSNLVKGILAITFGLITGCASVAVVVYPKFSLITDMVIIISFLSWVLINGTMEIFGAVRMKNTVPGKKWIFMLVLGILTVLSGIYGIYHIFLTVWAITIMFGVVLTIYSVRLLSSIFE